ncbi:uncharacterized protein [Clytia hemisphaerica]|uniref:PPPDE domain-containing protein n=1 Tax=Clytia hemisphaerica TaxID=252671 RepID=A0A7M5VCP7_9CNID|eukprot:TCONS_00008472-protein
MNNYSSGGSKDSTFRPEHDNTKRSAEVYIFLSTLEVMKNTVYESWDNFKHWALIFLFDSRRLKYELNNPSGQKTGGKIEPSWDDFHGVGTFEKMIFLGTITTSPKDINEAAKNNRLNGQTYHASKRNCQDWVIELLNTIDPSKSLFRSLKEEEIVPLKDSISKFLVDSACKSDKLKSISSSRR